MSKTENLYIVSTSDNLNKVLDIAGDKVVILLFYTKRNTDCQRAHSIIEKISLNHSLSIFCIVDMEKFEGESRYASNITVMPRIDCYHRGNMLCSMHASQDQEIRGIVENCERFVLTQGRSQGGMNNNMNMFAGMNPVPNQGLMNGMGMAMPGMMGSMPNMPNMNSMQNMSIPMINEQQRILNQLQTTNPMAFAQLRCNPMMLQQYIQQQLQQQQTLMQQPIQPQPNFFTTSPQPTQPQPATPDLGSSLSMQQMQQMFKIFQTMQKMGILPLPDSDQTSTPTPQPAQTSNQNVAQTLPDGAISLPDGSQLVPLPDGRYGLVKKN